MIFKKIIQKIRSKKTDTGELQKLQAKLDIANVKKRKLLDLLLDDTIKREDYNAKATELKSLTDELQSRIKELQSSGRAKSEMEALLELNNLIEEMAELKDDEINEQLYARVIERIIVHQDNVLEFHLRFLPASIFLRYRTAGRGKDFRSEFTIIVPLKQ